ncbi:MAG: hypothetical protein AAB795_00820 [Patescibacteria group bacterium]
MARGRYISQEFPMQCYGRDSNGKEVLKEPVEAKVLFYQFMGSETLICFSVKCIHNTGGYEQLCMASYLPDNTGKTNQGTICNMPRIFRTHLNF